ncbi:helix-turn-helix transcriptional regulator [bacterium]|nr:helix-turn-helix transcriptional regulator [bacterium]
MSEMGYDEKARILKAIAHPTRLQLLNMMRGDCPCVKNMEKALGLAQPNISQHLSLLRNVGIVACVRDGNQMCYSIKDRHVLKIIDTFND